MQQIGLAANVKCQQIRLTCQKDQIKHGSQCLSNLYSTTAEDLKKCNTVGLNYVVILMAAFVLNDAYEVFHLIIHEVLNYCNPAMALKS